MQVLMLGDQLAVMGRTKVNRFQWLNVLTKVDMGSEETSEDGTWVSG